MRFDVVTLFPEMFDALSQHGVSARAHELNLYQLHLWNPRDYTDDTRRTVDDRPYGGGPGMVMLAEPIARTIEAIQATLAPKRAPVIYLSPQGQRFTQVQANDRTQSSLIFLCGRYEGVDQRVIEQLVDAEWSIGDFILSGGELAAMSMMDAMIRQIPGALGNPDSAQQDSFMQDPFDCPHYTRPANWRGQSVPEVLLGGNHAQITAWRQAQALQKTQNVRPDLLLERATQK